MKPIEELMTELVETTNRLNELKAQSPEVAEALKIAEQYRALWDELMERCNPPARRAVPYPVPYPVYLRPYWRDVPPITITTTTSTTALDMQYRPTHSTAGPIKLASRAH